MKTIIQMSMLDIACTCVFVATIIGFTCCSFLHKPRKIQGNVYVRVYKNRVNVLLDETGHCTSLPRLPRGCHLKTHVVGALDLHDKNARLISWHPANDGDDTTVIALAHKGQNTSFGQACKELGINAGHGGVYALRRYHKALLS